MRFRNGEIVYLNANCYGIPKGSLGKVKKSFVSLESTDKEFIKVSVIFDNKEYTIFEDDLQFWLKFECTDDWEVEDKDFFEYGFDHEGAFSNFEEYKLFVKTLMNNYPNGVTEEYYMNRINMSKTYKSFERLIEKGLVRESEDDHGLTIYELTDKGKGVADLLFED